MQVFVLFFLGLLFSASNVLAGDDLSDFDSFQGLFSRDEIESRLHDYLEKNKNVGRFYRIDDQSFQLFDAKGVLEYQLRLRESSESTPTAFQVTENETQGLRVALDPGHIGGAYSEAEERHFLATLNGVEYTVKEGDISYYVAAHLKNLLEEYGVQVLMTREEIGVPVYGLPLSGSFMSQLYRHDLDSRVAKINAFDPDATVSIHMNYCGTESEVLTHTNFAMAFTGGGFVGSELKTKEARYEFMRLLLTDHVFKSKRLGEELLREFHETALIPPVEPKLLKEEQAPYLERWSLPLGPKGLYARNLYMTRKVRSPMVLGEAGCFDYPGEIELLHSGVLTAENSRVRQIAEAYLNGILTSFIPVSSLEK